MHKPALMVTALWNMGLEVWAGCTSRRQG